LTWPLATIEARTGSQQLNLFGIRSAIQWDGYVWNFEAYFDNLTATSYLNTIRGSSVIEESSKNNVEAADTIERAKDTWWMSNENIARAFEPINDAIKTIQNKVNATSWPIQAIYWDNFKTELQSLLDLNIWNEGAVKGLVPGNLVTLKDGVEELVSEIPLIERIHAWINTTEHQYLRDAIEPKVKEFIWEQWDNKIEKYADLIKTVDWVDGIILKLHWEIQWSPHENVFKTSLTQILTSWEAMESKCKFLKNSIPSLRSIYTSMRNIPWIVDETLVDLYSFLKNENRSTTDIEKIRKLFNDPYGGEFKNNIIYSDTNRLNTDFITNFINHRNDVDAVTWKKPEDITRERKRLVDEFLARDHTAIDPNPPVWPINPVDPIWPLRPDAEDEIIRKTWVELLSSDNHYIIMNDIMRDRFWVDLNEYLKDVLTAEYDDFDSAYQAATNELERGWYLIDDWSDSYKWAEPGDINTDDTKIDVDDTDVTDVDDWTERTPTPFERRIISEHIGDLNNPRNDFARSYRALLWELEMHPRWIEQWTINKIRSEVFDNNYRTPWEASGAINSILDTDYPGMSMRAGIPTSSYEIAELRFTLNVLDRAILLCELEWKRLKRDVASEIRRNIIEWNLWGNDIKNTLIDILKNSLWIDITEIPTTNSLISRHFDSRITWTPLTDDIRAEIERSYMDWVREWPSSRLSIWELIRNAVGR
jgi:hypothetical protein